MNCNAKRAARVRHFSTFAILVSALANLAYAAANISFTPASINFKYQAGSALPAAQSLQLKSTGTALDFTVSITGPLPYAAQWLSVSANAGVSPFTLKVYVNPTGLPSGSYSGTIVIASPSAGITSQNFPVTLDVGDAPATLSASTATLTFNFTTGGMIPPNQAIVLMTTGGALTAAISVTGGTWLKASPTGSIALVGLPGPVNVWVDPTGLTPGAYTGKIVFSSATAANKSVTVNVTLNVAAGNPTIAVNGVWPPGALVNSSSTIVTLTGNNFFQTSTAAVGATALSATVLSASAMLVTIPANLLTTAGNLAIIVTTPSALSSSAPATFVVYGPGPQVLAVTQSASYTTSTVSPGGLITVYGINLGPALLALFPGTDPIPTSLPSGGAATSVTVNGFAAPLLYTSATQVSFIAPYSLAARIGSAVPLILTYNALVSTAFNVNVVGADPGVFTVDASGTGQGAILNYNAATGDYTVNSVSNAAARGSTVSIYLTGHGVTTCADAPHSMCILNAKENNLIAGNVTPTGPVTVTIDGQNATVQGAAAPIGAVPGVLQINATVPAGAKPGNAVSVLVAIGAAKSQARVTMAVK